jgi:hypothetical protein
VGILGDQSLGPDVSPRKQTSAVYHRFLVNGLLVFLEHAPVQQQHKWFMHGVASPHFLRTVTQRPNQAFGEQYRGYGGPVFWPARSPNNITLDFWLWGT